MTSVREPDVGAGGSYYRRLEVGPGASRDEIVREYRRLALGVHPDAHPEDPQASLRFREITEAYEVLGDPVRREAYDGGGRSRHVPGLRRHTTSVAVDSSGQMASAEPPASGPPTILGASAPRLTRDVPLRVGPVRIEPLSGSDEESTTFAALLAETFDSWWQR